VGRRHLLIGSTTVFFAAGVLIISYITAEGATLADEHVAAARKRAAIAQENADRAALTAVIAEKEAERVGQKWTTARRAEVEHELAELKGRETAHGLVLTLSDLLFAPGQAEPTPAAMSKLLPLVTILKAQPLRTIRIEGHTDSRGPESYNLDLSRRRADAVRAFLIENGIPPQRITARGHGEAVAVASNATGAGRRENRRVEVIVPR
jgi:outer membrane protein OmpA-like peptidoglycan-associated protein